MALTWKGSIEESIGQFMAILEHASLSPEHKDQIDAALEKLRVREESLKLKRQADLNF